MANRQENILAPQGYSCDPWTNQLKQEGDVDHSCMSKDIGPIERKSSATCTKEIFQVDINQKNTVHLKLVLIY